MGPSFSCFFIVVVYFDMALKGMWLCIFVLANVAYVWAFFFGFRWCRVINGFEVSF